MLTNPKPWFTSLLVMLGCLFLPYFHADAPALAQDWQPVTVAPQHLVQSFAAPLTAWGAGHRGIDYLVTQGQVLLSPANGKVSFAGLVANKPVITLQSTDGVLASFEPACTGLPVGSNVVQGALIGEVCGDGYTSHCPPRLCLHLSARVYGGYLSPQYLLGQLRPSRLIY